jgi:hypothetical protein
MKQIKVLTTGIVQVSTAGTNVAVAMDLSREARRNKAKVIEGAHTVENQLETIIAHYFFGSLHERKSAFQALVLGSDWCSFSAKRKLISHIINELGLLTGEPKTQFEKLLSDVMSFRNAFTHGTLSSDDTRVWLSYFQGNPRKEELTDDYLTRVETTLYNAHEQTVMLSQKIGASKQVASDESA